MNNSSLVSVIIPVYNCERYIAEAIQSVLSQTYRALEVIIVDDGSTDKSASIVKSFDSSIRYYYQPNRGQAVAMNQGINLAHGDYLAFLDADDLWTKNKTMLQMQAFKVHPAVDIVSGHIKQFFSPELDENFTKKIKCVTELMPGHTLKAMLAKREVFDRIGLFETNWDVGVEMSWHLRAIEADLNIMMLPELVFLRRIHESNKGITNRHFINQRARILKASLDRRRKNNFDGLRTGNVSKREDIEQ